MRIAQRRGVVVMAQALIGREANRHRLMPAVHRHQVDVQINDEVRFRRAPRQPDFFLMLGLAEHREFGAILSVEIVEPVGPVLLECALAHDASDLRLGHAAMKRSGDHQVDVVDAVIGQRLEHLIEQPLANVRPAHLRQRQAKVIDRDGDAHVGIELREERILIFRMEQGVANRLIGIGQRVERRRRINHARTDRQLLEQELLAVRNQAFL